ncbi:UNVERIFIED_CONTAM: hypothetical protein K2H54_057415, partial [Gekko kuhli]
MFGGPVSKQWTGLRLSSCRSDHHSSGGSGHKKMADLYGYRDNTYSSESEASFNGTSSMTRPSGKAIYRQRKEYIESMINNQHEFKHLVEHLLTCYMNGKDICNVDNCIERLKLMNAQGQVWGQDMFLQVKNQNFLLTDIEAEVELDSYPLECIQECVCVLDSCFYNSILAITVKEMKLHRTSILLFQCEETGAQLMKTKLEKAIEEWKSERQSQDLLRNNLENMLHQRNQAYFNDNPHALVQNKRAAPLMESDHAFSISGTPGQRQQQHPWEISSIPMNYKRGIGIKAMFQQERELEYGVALLLLILGALIIAEAEPALRQQQHELSWEDSGLQTTQDTERETEILNHILSDIEIFVGKLHETNNPLNDKKKKKKSKKNQETLPPELEFKDCFQKIKYSFNLLNPVAEAGSNPSRIALQAALHCRILSSCPWTKLAPMVESPLLIPAAIRLLRHSLNSDEQITWKNLGDAWGLT